jgi:signal transduction histidine kinase
MAATLAHATALAAEAERGRSTVALAREDERRRLRRDLDGRVEPAVGDALRQARRLVDETSGDTGGDRLLGHLEDAAGHLRSVTDGLRLPVLDRHGLGGALATLVQDLGPVAGRAEVEPLPALPAATEVAAYVVAAEAVANALKHAAAASLVLRARVVGGVLEVQVEDDGRGMPPRPRIGVGLASARQRASEIGGTVDHAPAPSGGTSVVLRLPSEEVARRA